MRRPVRGGNDYLVAGIAPGHREVVEDLLGAGGDEDLRALVGEGVVAPELGDDRILELIGPLAVGIAGEATLDRILARLRNVRGGVEVRLARAQADHVLALLPQPRSPGGYGERRRGFDALEASCDRQGQ